MRQILAASRWVELAKSHVQRRSFLTRSQLARGQTGDDLIMGERAAVRANKALDKISGMYVGKNVGVSRAVGDSLEKVFGKRREKDAGEKCESSSERSVEFQEGPIGLEIQWTAPPVVVAVVPGGAGEAAFVQPGQAILDINGCQMMEALPELELEELMQQRPLQLRLGSTSTSPQMRLCDIVRQKGVAKCRAISEQTAQEVLEFMHLEYRRCIQASLEDKALLRHFFSNVQVPKASADDPVTRWDMRLPMDASIYRALEEMLGKSAGDEGLGATLEELAGPDAELWELGVVVTEPGAAPQPVHFDAAERCLYTTFVALQDVTYDMGPTHFWPGTNTAVAHRRFEGDPQGFLETLQPAAPLLKAGDSVIYDSRLLHCGGANVSSTRALLYVTFRDEQLDPGRLGIQQHSIRPALAKRFRLRHFRP